MYEQDDGGEVRDDDLASILEIMLGVENVEVAPLFLCLDKAAAESVTYGKQYIFFTHKPLSAIRCAWCQLWHRQ